MGKYIKFVFLLMPSILISIPIWVNLFFAWVDIYMIFVYVVSIIGIVMFFKYQPCKFRFLSLGLFLSPSIPIIWAVRAAISGICHIEQWFIFAVVLVIYYSLPLALVSIIVSCVKNIKAAKLNKSAD